MHGICMLQEGNVVNDVHVKGCLFGLNPRPFENYVKEGRWLDCICLGCKGRKEVVCWMSMVYETIFFYLSMRIKVF